MKKSLLTGIKEATADLSNQQYFLDTAPEEYCVDGYLNSCRGPSAKDESIEKRLQDEWRCKLLPRLKESHHQNLRETGTRLERAWKNEKRRLNELAEIVKDEQTTKKFKRGMKQTFQQQQLTIMKVSARRLERDLTDILEEHSDSSEPMRAASAVPLPSTESLHTARDVDSDGNEDRVGYDRDLAPSQLSRSSMISTNPNASIDARLPDHDLGRSTISAASSPHMGLFYKDDLPNPFAEGDETVTPSTWTLHSRSIGKGAAVGTRQAPDDHQSDESVHPLSSSGMIFPISSSVSASTSSSTSTSTSTLSTSSSSTSASASTANKQKSSTLEPPSPRTRKRAESDCLTLEPWRTLTKAVYLVANGQEPVFPLPSIDMSHLHLLMFKHIRELLTQYHEESRKNKGEEKEKDQTLLKDAMVALSGVMNVMSDRFVAFCEINSSLDIIDRATTAANINRFDEHECLVVLRSYHATLEEGGLEVLWYQVVQDRSAILSEFGPGKPLPPDAIIKIKVLRILDYLCHIITNPPYKTMEPSENDCLLIWAHLFSLISDDIELLSGERMLEASKAVRREQSREYGDLTEAGRKVDLAFCYSGIELSNIEFKRAGIPLKDITRQCRKNVRLGRCLQEFHRTIGMNDLSVIMADITGFVGFFYHIIPFENVWTAGLCTADFVQLPTNEGTLLAFMSEDETSLAQMFNYISTLSDKGKLAKRAKQSYDLQVTKQTVRQASRSSKPFSPPLKVKSLEESVVLSPSKKRN